MALPRLIGMYVLWLLAAGSVAVTAAVVITEVLVFAGIVDRSGSGYRLSLSVVTAAGFVALAAVPFVFRERFRIGDEQTRVSP